MMNNLSEIILYYPTVVENNQLSQDVDYIFDTIGYVGWHSIVETSNGRFDLLFHDTEVDNINLLELLKNINIEFVVINDTEMSRTDAIDLLTGSKSDTPKKLNDFCRKIRMLFPDEEFDSFGKYTKYLSFDNLGSDKIKVKVNERGMFSVHYMNEYVSGLNETDAILLLADILSVKITTEDIEKVVQCELKQKVRQSLVNNKFDRIVDELIEIYPFEVYGGLHSDDYVILLADDLEEEIKIYINPDLTYRVVYDSVDTGKITFDEVIDVVLDILEIYIDNIIL